MSKRFVADSPVIDQLKEIWIDGELDVVETANWVPNLTLPIRPVVPRFSPGKWLNGKGCRGPGRRKSAVVPTKFILKAANVPIIGGHHVLALCSNRRS